MLFAMGKACHVHAVADLHHEKLKLMMPLDSEPMITDWLQGVGTVGALLVSRVLAFVSIVLSYKDRKAKRDAEAMERARVFAHVEVDEKQITWRVVNASPYPVRQVHLVAIPFYVGAEGKKTYESSVQLDCRYIDPNSHYEEVLDRVGLPDFMRLRSHMENAVRLDFVDYQGTHWVRAANGRVTPIEKLKGGGFDELPRTLYEPDRPSRFKILLAWMKRLPL
jgi:hypothetical protein